MKANPHICWFLTGNEGGGVRSAVLNLLSAVRNESDWPVSALTVIDGDMTEVLREQGVPVGVLELNPLPQFSGRPWQQMYAVLSTLVRSRRFAQRAEECLPAGRPDIIHAQMPTTLHAAGSVARRIDAKVVWEMPNVVSSRAFGLNRIYYQLTCWRFGITVLANSSYTAATLGDRLCKPRTFYLGVDSGRFDPNRVRPVTREELGVPADAPLFVLAARIVPEKGQLRFAEALLEASKDTYLILLGGPIDSPEAERIRDLEKSSVADGRVRFLGHLADPERYIVACDVAVNARIDPEPFGLSVIEAMMLGKPVLAHAVGGPAETVLDGLTGWHVLDMSHAGLVRAIERVLKDRAVWVEMGERARQRALRQFSLAGQLRRYQKVVAEVLGISS